MEADNTPLVLILRPGIRKPLAGHLASVAGQEIEITGALGSCIRMPFLSSKANILLEEEGIELTTRSFSTPVLALQVSSSVPSISSKKYECIPKSLSLDSLVGSLPSNPEIWIKEFSGILAFDFIRTMSVLYDSCTALLSPISATVRDGVDPAPSTIPDIVDSLMRISGDSAPTVGCTAVAPTPASGLVSVKLKTISSPAEKPLSSLRTRESFPEDSNQVELNRCPWRPLNVTSSFEVLLAIRPERLILVPMTRLTFETKVTVSKLGSELTVVHSEMVLVVKRGACTLPAQASSMP